MKRTRHSQNTNAQDFVVYEDNFGANLQRQLASIGRHLTPSPEQVNSRPSKVRRHGSKFLSVLRSLTNSTSSASNLEVAGCDKRVSSPTPYPSVSPPPELPPTRQLSKKISLSFLKISGQTPAQSTIVHRVKSRGHPSIGTLDRAIIELVPEASACPEASVSSEETSVASGKSSNLLARTHSTGKTSVESKQSGPAKVASGQSQNSADKKTTIIMDPVPETPLEAVLTTTQEPKIGAQTKPTVITVERAAGAKIFFETHYNGLFSTSTTARSMRRRELEGALHQDLTLTPLEKEEERRDWARRETDHLREVRAMKSRVSGTKTSDKMAASFEVVKILGKGSFGVVRLVREKLPLGSPDHNERRKEVYAMKVIRKTDMLRNSQEGHLRAERDFLVSSEGSRWVVPLIASFQDTSNLYLVMDYMPGGDFLGLLIRDNILSESVTKWYIAEMILCIEEAHRLKWIHRDVKPDNFLISASGHLKISDFGLAFDGHWSHDQGYFNHHRYSLLSKLGIKVEGDTIDKQQGRSIGNGIKSAQMFLGGIDRHEKKDDSSGYDLGEGILNWRNCKGNRALAKSVVGTSQYMAPEVIQGLYYDARCDWWSVAVILYECLYGHTPFLAEEGGRQATKNNILRHQDTFAFPHKPVVSSRCQDLIRRIIKDAPDRLCCKSYKTRDISGSYRDRAGHYVYPNDAEDIKAHRWFKDIQWDHLHHMTPPFVPVIQSVDDTHYFDEEDPISDFSSSHDIAVLAPPAERDIDDALRCFNREIQILARGFVAASYDSMKLRKMDNEIEKFIMGEEQKEYLKAFIRAYGQKERKRPRDILLRDKDVAGKVLEVRRKGAFIGYSYRQIRCSAARKRPSIQFRGKGNLWARQRVSIF